MKYRGKSYHAWLLSSAAATAIMWAGSAAAEDAQFNIAPQPLASALNEFSLQSKQSVLFTTELAQSKASRGVSGQVEVADALSSLLAGTGLTYRRNGNTFLIVDANDPQSGSAAGDGADGTVQALVVTAQKREEDIQDVPIAISAFTQEDLTRSQVAGGPDLVTQVPNFTFTKTNFSGYSIQIRGIGTQAISATTDPAVAVAFNNTPFIRNRFFEQEFYDLERVEVLRGPQGTLYGRNATGGVVNIISAKPKFRYEAKLSADLGNYSSSRLEGMVNIPLVEDKVALRLAGAWTKRDGYVTNELTGKQTDGRDLWSTRLSLRIQPNDRINANLIWEHFQEDDDRLRSGKQLCRKDVVTHVGDVPVTNYYNIRGGGGQGGSIMSGTQATFSQGCKRESLYDNSSFQRPNGLMLPYYLPLSVIGLARNPDIYDPYAAVVDPSLCTIGSCDPHLIDATNDQPEDLRVIQSTVNPQYRAKSDIGELQVSFDLTDKLTLTSETGYGVDFVHSLEDYNRFNTAANAWGGGVNVLPGLIQRGVLRTDLGPNPTFCDPQLGCSDRLVAVDLSTAKATQFSQEFRLASDFDGPFNFSLGANFLRADSEDKYYVFFNSISLIAAGGTVYTSAYGNYVPGVTTNEQFLFYGFMQGATNTAYTVVYPVYMDPNPIGNLNDEGHNYFLSKNPYKLISYAMFGEAYYKITDNLKLTAGLRWTVDKKEAPRVPTWVLVPESVGYPVAEVIRQQWREPTGRLALDWKPDLSFTDETLIYGSIAHGYKAGGANPPGFIRAVYGNPDRALAETPPSATRPTTFDPEYVNAFELGSKNTLDEGRVTLNLAGFYYDYTGYQVSEIVDRSAYNRNFDATVWGAELEGAWRPLENLKLGLKLGYEKTRIADGESAVDLMDRANGGKPDANGISWLVVRPFPTYASSCILPVYVYANPNGTIGDVGGVAGGGPGGCEIAYAYGYDPVTDAPYVDLANGGVPVNPYPGGIWWNTLNDTYGPHPGYPGFDPSTAPNGGEGISKPLGGNQLPNAPHYTATVTGDYTLPLANDWLMTLHSDVHWQSQSWWRVFNDHAYDKLHPYFTMNLAAIFTNEDAGWNIMAYIKNVTDETAITGAFLNSDDTGLTTNFFLTEPRLYGMRVTKNWSGGPLLGSLGARHDGPYPFTIELGGQIQRHDAPNSTIAPSYASAFQGPLDVIGDPQRDNLDWGDGREVKVTWQPAGRWSVSAGVRFGKANAFNKLSAVKQSDPACFFSDPYTCAYFAALPGYEQWAAWTMPNQADARIWDKEDHEIADFAVGYDVGFGELSRSKVQAGLRYADLKSDTRAALRGVPDWAFQDGFLESPNPIIHHLYNGDILAEREFKGAGPTVSWDAAYPLLGDPDAGHLDVDWSLTGGVLFGDRKVKFSRTETVYDYNFGLYDFLVFYAGGSGPATTTTTNTTSTRSQHATVPTASASLGLSYSVGGFTAGAGYRWERYFNAIDGGFADRKSYDRTIDGPYFKVSVGFGG